MRHINKITTALCAVAFGLMALAGCEGSEKYSVDSPDWLQDQIDAIAASKTLVLPEGEEDVYTIGNTDFTSGWWQSSSHTYVIPDDTTWNAVFYLNINPNYTELRQNFALVMSTGAKDKGTEYGAIRYDWQPTKNAWPEVSEWGKLFDSPSTERSQYVTSNLRFADGKDNDLTKLSGQIVLSVDRQTEDSFIVTMNNGTVKKRYARPTDIAPGKDITCFLVPINSYINFKQSNIEPTEGFTSSDDKSPVSITVTNWPTEYTVGSGLEAQMQEKKVSAVVYFQDEFTGQQVQKQVAAKDLIFALTPNDEKEGAHTLVVAYNKTYLGEEASKTVSTSHSINGVLGIKSIAVTTQPTHKTYYFCTTTATKSLEDRTLAFDPTGMVVTATYYDGNTAVIDNNKLTYTSVSATAGTQYATISTTNGKTATVAIDVKESTPTIIHPTADSSTSNTVGLENNTTPWWTYFSSYHKVAAGETAQANFTNYTAGDANYKNWIVVVCNQYNRAATGYVEAGVARADNFGWGNGWSSAKLSGGPADWTTWLAALNGATCKMYVTNCGNGTCDLQCVMTGNNGVTYNQYYLGISTVDVDNMRFFFTVEGGHLVFDAASGAKRYVRR